MDTITKLVDITLSQEDVGQLWRKCGSESVSRQTKTNLGQLRRCSREKLQCACLVNFLCSMILINHIERERRKNSIVSRQEYIEWCREQR